MGFSPKVQAASVVSAPPVGGGAAPTSQDIIDATFTPVAMSGLQVMLDSAYGHTADPGEAIASITERSPNARVFTQATLADRPVLSTPEEGLGGVPAIKVTADNQYLSLAVADDSLGMGATGLTVVSVLKSSAAGNNDGRGLISLYSGGRATWALMMRAPYQASEIENYGAFYAYRANATYFLANPGKVADGTWHVLTQVVDRAADILQLNQDWAGFSLSGLGTLADGAAGTVYVFRYHTGSGSGVGNALLRFLFVFNRALPADELAQLHRWIDAEIGKQSRKHTKLIDRDIVDTYYVRGDGNDTQDGRANTAANALLTLAEACDRLDDVPFVPNSSGVPLYPVGDGSFATRKAMYVGPGVFKAPMFANLHATMIIGTKTALETRNIVSVSVDGNSHVGPITLVVDGAALTNDAWRGATLQVDGSDYYRLTVSRNTGNTLYCSSDRAMTVIGAATTVTRISFDTEIQFPATRYHAIMNCWELYFCDCRITIDPLIGALGGFVNVGGGSYVWFVGCEIDNIGITARHAKVFLRRTYWAPNFGSFVSGFWPVTRQFGRLTLDGVTIDGIRQPQYRIEVQDSTNMKMGGGVVLRDIQGIRAAHATIHTQSSPYDWAYFDNAQFGFDFLYQNSAPPPFTSSAYNGATPGNWDIRAVGGANIVVPATGGKAAYKTSADFGVTEGSCGPDGTIVYCSDPTKVSFTPRDWTAMSNLAAGWAAAGGVYASPAYAKEASGRNMLRGAISGGSPNVTIYTLPAGLRPSATRVFIVPTSTGLATLSVESTGAISVLLTDGGTVFLDSVAWVI